MRTALKTSVAALALATATTAATAEPVAYDIDTAHSEILFTWTHGEFSTTRGIFFGFDGDFMLDQEDPANSSISISVPTSSVMANSEMKEHWSSDDFFGDNFEDDVTFTSTSIEVDDDDEAEITGDLTLNGVTNEVVLEAELNSMGTGPQGNEVVGFSAETTIMRSDYDLGMFTPFVSDEVEVTISMEASPASE